MRVHGHTVLNYDNNNDNTRTYTDDNQIARCLPHTQSHMHGIGNNLFNVLTGLNSEHYQ